MTNTKRQLLRRPNQPFFWWTQRRRWRLRLLTMVLGKSPRGPGNHTFLLPRPTSFLSFGMPTPPILNQKRQIRLGCGGGVLDVVVRGRDIKTPCLRHLSCTCSSHVSPVRLRMFAVPIPPCLWQCPRRAQNTKLMRTMPHRHGQEDNGHKVRAITVGGNTIAPRTQTKR